jgi:hypothetical protein
LFSSSNHSPTTDASAITVGGQVTALTQPAITTSTNAPQDGPLALPTLLFSVSTLQGDFIVEAVRQVGLKSILALSLLVICVGEPTNHCSQKQNTKGSCKPFQNKSFTRGRLCFSFLQTIESSANYELRHITLELDEVYIELCIETRIHPTEYKK